MQILIIKTMDQIRSTLSTKWDQIIIDESLYLAPEMIEYLQTRLKPHQNAELIQAKVHIC